MSELAYMGLIDLLAKQVAEGVALDQLIRRTLGGLGYEL